MSAIITPVAMIVAVLVLAACNSTAEQYDERPVSEWPSQRVLESLPDD